MSVFRWTSAAGMQLLGDLPGGDSRSEAYQTSANGSVMVGYGYDAVGMQPARWVNGGGISKLTGGAINADDGAADGFDIRATSVPVRAFGQGGDDAFRVSSAAGTLDRIGGDLTIVGGTGTNTLSVSDVGAAGGNADVRLAGDAITGFAGPNDDRAITHSGIASLSASRHGPPPGRAARRATSRSRTRPPGTASGWATACSW